MVATRFSQRTRSAGLGYLLKPLCLAFVLVAPLGVSATAEEVPLQAIVILKDETLLSSEMSGRLVQLPLDEGERFETGELLAKFNCDILEGEKSVAVANKNAAQAELDNAQRLDKLGVAGALDLALAKAAFEKAMAELEVSRSMVRRCSIRAPFSGVVLSRVVEPHESVDALAPLMRIARADRPRVSIIAPAHWLNWVRKGTRFTFVPRGGERKIAGRLDWLAAAVDAASQTVKLEGQLEPASGSLFPGMGGVAAFKVPTVNRGTN